MSFPLAQLLIFFVVAGTDIGTAIYYRYVLDKVQSIGYVAHFAGKCTLWRACVLKLVQFDQSQVTNLSGANSETKSLRQKVSLGSFYESSSL